MNILKRDLKEEAKIHRRRQNEEARKPRIFNAKTRLFGVDTDAWEHQLMERRKNEEKTRREDVFFDAQRREQDEICIEWEKKEMESKREFQRRLVEFRNTYQQPAFSSTFALNDPQANKRESYSENGEFRFEGEDETFQKRRNVQKEQNKAWLLQQMAEKKLQCDREREQEEKKLNTQLALDERAKRIADLEEQCRRRMDETIALYNSMLAKERAAEEKKKRGEENMIDKEEIKNWTTGDFLTENPKVAQSALGSRRIIAFKYKGEPPEREIDTKRDQLQQSLNNSSKKQQERENVKKWEDTEKCVNQTITQKWKRLMQDQRELDRKMVEINSKLAEEHKRREIQNNSVRDLHPTPEFYDQFNRTTY